MVLLRHNKMTIRDAADVAKVFQDLLRLEDKIDRDKEHFYVMHLDSRQRINLVELVAIGTLNAAIVHPRETYRRAVTEGTQGIIIAHNHPSGEVTPSDNDIRLTTQLEKAGEILYECQPKMAPPRRPKVAPPGIMNWLLAILGSP